MKAGQFSQHGIFHGIKFQAFQSMPVNACVFLLNNNRMGMRSFLV